MAPNSKGPHIWCDGPLSLSRNSQSFLNKGPGLSRLTGPCPWIRELVPALAWSLPWQEHSFSTNIGERLLPPERCPLGVAPRGGFIHSGSGAPSELPSSPSRGSARPLMLLVPWPPPRDEDNGEFHGTGREVEAERQLQPLAKAARAVGD